MVSEQQIRDLLEAVKDPEIPVVSIRELGILRDIQFDANGQLLIMITPTYSGCPAMDTIRADIHTELLKAGIEHFDIHTQLAPAWTTDWITPEARQRLREYGIAPPQVTPVSGCTMCPLTPETGIQCPRCAATDTLRISEFGSTACKALFQCRRCHEPFDYFKPL